MTQAAQAEIQSAKDAWNRETQTWMQSEHSVSARQSTEFMQQVSRTQQQREQALTEHIEQEADSRYEHNVAMVQQNATLQFQAQEQEAYLLEVNLHDFNVSCLSISPTARPAISTDRSSVCK